MRLCFLKIFHTHTLPSSIFSASKSHPSQYFRIYPSSTGWDLKEFDSELSLGYLTHLKAICKDMQMVCRSSAWVRRSIKLLRSFQYSSALSQAEENSKRSRGKEHPRRKLLSSSLEALVQITPTSRTGPWDILLDDWSVESRNALLPLTNSWWISFKRNNSSSTQPKRLVEGKHTKKYSKGCIFIFLHLMLCSSGLWWLQVFQAC